MAKPAIGPPSQQARWAAYLAAVWAFAFAAVSFYWAAGGTLGLSTLGVRIEQLARARDPLAVWIGGWVVGVLKVIGGLIALALVQPWGRWVPRRLLRWFVWGAGIGMILYGAASFVQHGLMITGAINLPAGLGRTGARGHLFLWDPWWTLGGVLFVLSAWWTSRQPAQRS